MWKVSLAPRVCAWDCLSISIVCLQWVACCSRCYPSMLNIACSFVSCCAYPSSDRKETRSWKYKGDNMMCLTGKKHLNKTCFLVCRHQWNLRLWMYKHLSISLLTLFLGAFPTVGTEQEEDAESPWDSEVLFVKDKRVSTAGSRSKIQNHLRVSFSFGHYCR